MAAKLRRRPGRVIGASARSPCGPALIRAYALVRFHGRLRAKRIGSP
jgi:hypothetical protein